MTSNFNAQDDTRLKFLLSLFAVVVISAIIIASLGALLGYEKVFFPFVN